MAKYEGNSPTGENLSGLSETSGLSVLRTITWTGMDKEMERYLNYNPSVEDHQFTMHSADMWMILNRVEEPPSSASTKHDIEKLKAMENYLQGLEEAGKRVQENIEKHVGNMNAWKRQAELFRRCMEDQVRSKQNKRKADQMEDSSDSDESSYTDWDSVDDNDRYDIINAIKKVMKAVRERIEIWNSMTKEDWKDKESWLQKSNLVSHKLGHKALERLYKMEYRVRERLGVFAVTNEKSQMPKLIISDYEAVWAGPQDSDDSE
ncbi:hypothetical protein QBC37DRAFT_379626 [Rhypophila decipiens]|uniref:Uncharacterized protein n=1 Tax=Rhypophila decipiens TaxID=261697 RepID=A0AAN6XWI6_9PEZI|nr:hypothetical protein QBC37DRAFT_379626 [Rhypophila decipiens]